MRRIELRTSCAGLALLLYIALIATVPLVLLGVGLKQPGIDLEIALGGRWTTEAFERLLTGSGIAEAAFRAALGRSMLYATVAASVAVFLSFCYAFWVAGWSSRRAISVSFTLLTLVLLPQTYLVLPVLGIVSTTAYRLPSEITITVLECLAVTPLSAFVLHLLAGERIGRLMHITALDGYLATGAWRRIGSEQLPDLAIVFGLTWAIAWGIYLIPFSLGDHNSYTVLVQIASLTSNLGRDWAMICAAGFVVTMPSLAVVALIGVRWARQVSR